MEGEDMDPCLVFYASQSGRAKACARRTSRLLREVKGKQVVANTSFDEGILDVQAFASTLRERDLLVFFVSTTGDGEQTDNMRVVWKQLLQKGLPSNLFEKTSFALFCLGDRAYGEQFCAAGRKLAVRLLQLGATLFCDVGYGDDGTPNGGVFADLDQWLQDDLLPKMETKNDVEDVQSPASFCAYEVHVLPEQTEATNLPARDQWQQKKYSDSYRNFMDHLQPLTAYQYEQSAAAVIGLKRVDVAELSSMKHSSLLLCNTVFNDRITALDWEQNTRHIRLEFVSDQEARQPEAISTTSNAALLPYRAGDVAAILPYNSDAEVQRFLDVLPSNVRMLADRDLEIQLKESIVNNSDSSLCTFWPTRCTLRGWLSLCADIHSLPEREDLRALAAYCDVENHPLGIHQRDKLIGLSETSEAALYVDYILREKRSLADVLYDFDSLRQPDSPLTVESLFTLLAPIRPREFSIASSPTKEVRGLARKSHPSKAAFGVEHCVAVVEGKTPLGRSFHGLCSDYLSRLEVSSLVRMWIRPGTFQGLPLEMDATTGTLQSPILFVGAGTGIAPLRGLIQEREAVRESVLGHDGAQLTGTPHKMDEVDRDNILLFGCRKQKSDFYYEGEWSSLCETGRLCLLTAFSQDQWHKIYVQQVLIKANDESGLLSRLLLERSGAIYIAGGPKMARAVKDEIVEALASMMDGDTKRAKQLLTGLQRIGRFSIEAWS